MSMLIKTFVALVLLLLAGTTVFLATWPLPAPSGTVEKVIPDDRFKH